ncbi:MAG: sulfite exporter TauE/SafE family protein [Aquisalimonadaceae bacterium]
MVQLALIFLAGMAGSFHCVGMCGGFACALGRAPGGSRTATLVRHLLYNSGRVVSYMFLGGVAGAMGGALLATGGGGLAVNSQRVLAVLAGSLMILMALQLLGYLQRIHAPASGFIGHTVTGSLRGVLQAPGHGAPLAFGVFNGFLPCPLVYAFLALAGATGDPLGGLLLMGVFGLGTFPAMLLTGGLGAWLRYGWRRRGVRIAGVFILLLGAITLARGLLPMELHGGHGLGLPAIEAKHGSSPRDGGHAH